MDFLCGFPIECVEMLMYVGQFSSTKEILQEAVKEGAGKVHAPVPGPGRFFEWPEERNILLNVTAKPTTYTDIFPADIAAAQPVHAHWWIRLHLDGYEKYPVPGELGFLGVRMMPDMFWGKQKSSPFLYSGNYMDTVYYTGAVVKTVIEPTQDKPYPRYLVQWRMDRVEARPTDFAEYKVDDRVTILKNVTTDKATETWMDYDTNRSARFPPEDDDKVDWKICPIGFYGLDDPSEE
jgi:hypothetical protein